MRILEIILLALSAALVLYLLINSSKSHKKIKIGIILSLLIIQLIFEGYRWQMIPIYFILIISIICIHKEYTILKGNWFLRAVKIITLFIFLALGYVLPTALPILELPATTGSYKVGSRYIHLKTEREEIITENLNDKRELMVKVWYPANIKKEQTEAYLNDGDRISFAKKYGLPSSTFNYLDYVKTNTYEAPSVVDEKFPVLIFSHGSYSKASGYYAIIEDIVSHGYIILNINHTYESTGTLFPDGTIRLYNKEYDQKKISTQKMGEMAWKSQQGFNNAKNENERFLVSKNILQNYIAAEITRNWSKDISSVIDVLKTWNTSTFLANHIDIDKIGVFGHSQGASAAGQSLLDDSRITAALNLDGVQWGSMIDSTLTKPFLNISSDWKSPHPNFNKYAFGNGSSSVFYDAKIKNSGHASFMDIPLMINVPQLNESGTINPNKAYQIINKIIISFFNNHLKNKDNNLLNLKDQFPNLEIELKK